MNLKKYILLFILAVAFTAIIDSCKKVNTPPNPYDSVNYGNNTGAAIPPDPNSIVGIHKNILSTKCAMPGCHDGHFEPDFRTVQSSYSTLVYHNVKKYSVDSAFKYRVVPYDTAKSWVHERLITGDANLGRMPLYSTPLSKSEMANINTWIMNGAKDLFGNPAILPNTKPTVVGFIATDSAFYRIDTIRVDNVFYNAFKAPANSKIKIVMVVEDDSTAIENLKVNKLKLSHDKDNFTAALSYTATFITIGTYKVWIAEVNTAVFSTGDILYMRYYVNDGNHSTDTEFPTNESATGYKTYFSFKVQ